MVSFPDNDSVSDEEIIAAARAQVLHIDGIQIDDGAELSVGDDGVWVQAWIYQSYDTIPQKPAGKEGGSGAGHG